MDHGQSWRTLNLLDMGYTLNWHADTTRRAAGSLGIYHPTGLGRCNKMTSSGHTSLETDRGQWWTPS